MIVRKLFPGLFVACFALGLAANAAAQANDFDGRPRVVLTNKVTVKPVETAPTKFPPTKTEKRAPVTSVGEQSLGRFNFELLTAIESHLGSSYHFNTTGPDSFDCSGFVWRAYQDVGVNFQRGPARSYWAAFAPPSKEEEFKFGNLVFFSGLTHVGIVADEKGFYHSARHGGVVYSPFNDYWLSRIDGFRRPPLESLPLNEKARAKKPATNVQSVDDDDGP
ncbi:MAG TPA: C40 family peptidase [Pyrinomonadaceae bacterium]|nr:C40 family peptidase [Pyrinomonadaceae bacterium]